MTLLTPPGTVIFVDDDPVVRAATVQALELADLAVMPFAVARPALARIDASFNGVVVSDIRLPEIDGLQLFRAVQAIDPTIPVILITGHGDVPMAVAALRDGVDDFIPKPFASAHLIASVQRGLERRRLELDNCRLRAMVAEAGASPSALIGETPAIVHLREAIVQAANARIDVLIEGEAGVGKELIALMLHRCGPRRGQPFVALCGDALPGEVAMRQWFGAGDAADWGQIAGAHRGTLYLEDIDRLDPTLQALVLRFVEDREIPPVGAHARRPIDLRIIAASKIDLCDAVEAGRFREDLFHALNVVRLRIPPLRERRADIPLLFAHFMDDATTQLRRAPAPLSDRVRDHLIDHHWPGNVRELKSFAFQAAIGFDSPSKWLRTPEALPLPSRVGRFEASVICAILSECQGNAAEAIHRLGIPRKTFYDKLHRHGIDIASFRVRGGINVSASVSGEVRK